MKRLIVLSILTNLLLGACLPAAPDNTLGPAPISEADLQATAAVLSQQTLQSLPTQTAVSTETAIIVTSSQTATQATATETANPALLTLTATLLAGTSTLGTQPATTGTIAVTTGTPGASTNPGGSPQPLFYGTQPPALVSGTISLFNKADVEVYISMRCVTKEGYVSILEYPVKKNINVSSPAGNYTYIAWVGGRQFDGSFKLDNEGFVTITFFANRINIKNE